MNRTLLSSRWPVLLFVVPMLSSECPVRATDHLFAIQGRQQGAIMLTLDPDSGDVVDSEPVTGAPILHGITFDGWTLVGIDRPWTGGPDRLFRIHPADAQGAGFGQTGFAWYGNSAIEWDPQSGRLINIFGADVFEVDPTTGAGAYIGTLSGLSTFDGIDALARDSFGTFIGIGWSTVFSGSQGISVYAIDLSAMLATRLGGLPGASFYYSDIAFDSRGTLWASVEDASASWPPWRLCQIDLATMTRTVVRVLPIAYAGLASVPDMQATSYCQAKLGSIGCAPTCTWTGLGSPTASRGFDVSASNVISETWGSLYYGLGQQATLPFGGGTLCIRGALRRAGLVWSGGSTIPSCDGVWTIDFNEWMATHVAIPAGTTVRAQWLGRDPGFAPPTNWQMSNALEFVLRP